MGAAFRVDARTWAGLLVGGYLLTDGALVLTAMG